MTTREERKVLPVSSGEDVVRVRQATRELAVAAGFSLVDTTKMITAASEIARNTLEHGGGGEVALEFVRREGRDGVRLTFEDQGPGISDVTTALRDGFTSANGLGLGLGGAKRLVNEFDIRSAPGQGTRVVLTRWKG